MQIGKLVFSQVIDHLPMHGYDGNRYKKAFSCLDQYLFCLRARGYHQDTTRYRCAYPTEFS